MLRMPQTQSKNGYWLVLHLSEANLQNLCSSASSQTLTERSLYRLNKATNNCMQLLQGCERILLSYTQLKPIWSALVLRASEPTATQLRVGRRRCRCYSQHYFGSSWLILGSEISHHNGITLEKFAEFKSISSSLHFVWLQVTAVCQTTTFQSYISAYHRTPTIISSLVYTGCWTI